MKKIGLYQAKTQLSMLVASVEQSGETIALTRHGKVVAELHPPTQSVPKRGCLKSKNFHLDADFDTEDLGFEDFWATTENGESVAETKPDSMKKRAQ